MITAKTGVAHGSDSYVTAIEATTEAFDINNENTPLAVMVLTSIQYNPEIVLKGVRSVVGEDIILVGATTAGEITERGPTKKQSIVVMVFYGTGVTAYTGVGRDIASSAYEAGVSAATDLQNNLKKDNVTADFVILLEDVLTGNGADVVRGVQSILGERFPIVGGAAGDDFKFEKTYQFHGNEVLTSSIVALSFVGEVTFGVGVRHGWMPVGLPMKVTKASGAVVHEIDGKPAIDVYTEYFGEAVAQEIRSTTLAQTAITYPLGIKLGDTEEYLIRDPLMVSEDGSITCAAEIPIGSEINIMLGSKEEAIRHAKIAAEQALDSLGQVPNAIIVFNCIARSKLFAQDGGDEISAIQSVLGTQVPLIGFYTYGEQAPLLGKSENIKQCEASFHNETIVIFALA